MYHSIRKTKQHVKQDKKKKKIQIQSHNISDKGLGSLRPGFGKKLNFGIVMRKVLQIAGMCPCF